jgi:alkylhydroperoxidase family enzyme
MRKEGHQLIDLLLRIISLTLALLQGGLGITDVAFRGIVSSGDISEPTLDALQVHAAKLVLRRQNDCSCCLHGDMDAAASLVIFEAKQTI